TRSKRDWSSDVCSSDLGPAAHRAAVPMELSATDLKLGPDRSTGELVLRGEIEGLRVTKTLTFHAETYTIDTKIRLDNAGGSTRRSEERRVGKEGETRVG